MANRLALESSPYLLQHAQNPVDWFPWGEEAFSKAKEEDKLVLVSIGYSSCHWCHVMEHESFESQEVAEVMNRHFVCIKIDREERPDIDAVYMEAVQLISGRGGWPLNCFTLPNGKPIYGGTYFPKQNWIGVLEQLNRIWKEDRNKTLEYAEELTKGVAQKAIVPPVGQSIDYAGVLKDTLAKWETRFDNVEGGPNRAPKFPLPGDYVFLMRQAFLTRNDAIQSHVDLTLKKMAYGGIYDQVGGGFARYSVDALWKVPHFEKMLYDNGQLLGLYAEAYIQTRNPLYKQIVEETIEWVKREMTHPEGGVFSALDADSEGEEGKFYVWQEEELRNVLGGGFDLFKAYFNINEFGYWEDGNYIPLRMKDDAALAVAFGISVKELNNRIFEMKGRLLEERKQRVRPGLDDKVLLSWNALWVKGLCMAYKATLNPEYKQLAKGVLEFLLHKFQREDGGLFHTYKNGKAGIDGFLDDYAFMISALIAYYSISFEEAKVLKAMELMEYTLVHFDNPGSPLLYFTSAKGEALIVRRTEYMDNVLPCANSELAVNLFQLARLTGRLEWEERSATMLNSVVPAISDYGSAFSNWCQLMQWMTYGYKEIVIAGPNAEENWGQLVRHYLPSVLVVVAGAASGLELMEGRTGLESNLIFVCENRACMLPVGSVGEVLEMLR
ncbi:MAG: thioredoxin domain-containing protein [Bacteroidia bacterium]|nr:thioredoxin domain-containing protein [Bacteroidia bacterium]